MRLNRNVILFSISIFLFSVFLTPVFGDNVNEPLPNHPIQKKEGRERFVKNLMQDMSIRDMIGQLIIVGTDTDEAYYKKINTSIDSLRIGGICFFKGNTNTLVQMRNNFDQRSKIPMFFSIDGEWGLGMRMNDGYSFPRQLTIGATNNEDLIYEMGKNIALQCKSLGIHINFAPSVDINNNPKNPVINVRSFGEDKKRVAKNSWAYVKGMQDNGILTTIKHFPGHGDTELDSHHALPVITHSKEYIDSVDVDPFRYAIDKGAWGVMVGHLNIPSLIFDSILPSSLSKEIITDYLKDKLEFEGLVFTDALNMKGVTNNYNDGEAEVRALIAGVDILLMPKDEYKAVEAIEKAIAENRISEDEIRDKCKKVLRWKYDLGLFGQEKKIIQIPEKKLIDKAESITNQLSESIITVLKNEDNILPLDPNNCSKIALVEFGSKAADNYYKNLSLYCNVKRFLIEDKINPDSLQAILNQLDSVDYVIASISANITATPKSNYGVTKQIINNLDLIQKRQKTILTLFTNPYVLASLDTLTNLKAVIIGYQNIPQLESHTAQCIFGANEVSGRLPVTVSNTYKVNSGISKSKENLAYEDLLAQGMNVDCFIKIDSIANEGIIQKAYPGCQIIVLKSGNIVYNKSYGYQTYDSTIAVTPNTVYDIASLTKIFATTLSVMKLYEEGKIDLDDKLSKYLPYLKKTNKKKITIRQALSHNARLKAWSPFWKEYIGLNDSDFEDVKYKEEILKKIAKSELNKEDKYEYSDFGFILLGDMVQRITNQSLDDDVYYTFYKPMGLKHITYKPIGKIPDSLIAPTEDDRYFRNRLIKGTVHDQTSAILNGVSGHAGLFSNAHDVSVICQMLLNGGEYGGVRYLENKTIQTFNTRYFKKQNNRRALGFDKTLINTTSTHCSKYASSSSYGHSGFTGTYFWSDPEKEISFIFLSNRVYPNTEPNLLGKLDIRTRINDLIYESLNGK